MGCWQRSGASSFLRGMVERWRRSHGVLRSAVGGGATYVYLALRSKSKAGHRECDGLLDCRVGVRPRVLGRAGGNGSQAAPSGSLDMVPNDEPRAIEVRQRPEGPSWSAQASSVGGGGMVGVLLGAGMQGHTVMWGLAPAGGILVRAP